jgi:hypothetical protein
MAAANLGSLVATVAANTKPFQSGMKRANGMLSQLGQKLGVTDKALKTMAKTAAAAAAAFLGFKKGLALVGQVGERIDEMAKRARGLGGDINEMAQLQYAARIAGGDEERFFSTLGRMMLNLGQATPAVRRSIKALGEDFDDLTRKSPADVFLALQEAIAKVPNRMEAIALAGSVFGSRMENIKPLMNMLGTDVRGAMEEFKRLHGHIDGQKWEDYIDDLTRVETAWLGLKMVLAEDILPAFVSIVNIAKEIVVWFRKWWPLIRNVGIALGVVATAIWGIRAAKIAYMRIVPIFATMIKAITTLQFGQAAATALASMNFAAYAKVVAAATAVTVASILAFKEMDKAQAALEKETGGGNEPPFQDLIGQITELEALAKRAQAILAELRTPDEIFADTLNELALIKAKFEELGLTAQQAQLIWNRGVASALKTLLESKKVMDSIRQAGSLKLGTMAEASGRMAAERQQQRQTEYLDAINQAMATANDILADIRDNIQPPPGNVPALP